MLFQSQCASCHAVQPSPLVQKAWATPVMDVGTDRRTFDRAQQTGSPRATEGHARADHSRSGTDGPIGQARHSGQCRGRQPGAWRPATRPSDPARDQSGFRRGPSARSGHGHQWRHPPADAAANVQQATKDLYKTPRQAPGAAYEARVLTGILGCRAISTQRFGADPLRPVEAC